MKERLLIIVAALVMTAAGLFVAATPAAASTAPEATKMTHAPYHVETAHIPASTDVRMPARRATDGSLYWFRACSIAGSLALPDKWACEKFYAHRQTDGDGWRLNGDHIYAWTAGEGQGHCGSGYNDPAVAGPSTPKVLGSQENTIWDATNQNLTYANGCDREYNPDSSVWFSPGGDHFTVQWTEKMHLVSQGDPNTETLKIVLSYDGSGGINFRCVANDCAWGPA